MGAGSHLPEGDVTSRAAAVSAPLQCRAHSLRDVIASSFF